MTVARPALVLVLLLPLLGGWDLLRSPDPDVESGRERFEAGDYPAAVEAYRRALDRREDDPAVHFNLGAAYYESALRKVGDERARQFALAERAFRVAAVGGQSALRVAAHYNLGNVLFQTGRHADAVAAYRQVLQLRPGDRDARHNLELALRALRDQARPSAAGGPDAAAHADGDDDDADDADGDSNRTGSNTLDAGAPPDRGDGAASGAAAEAPAARDGEAGGDAEPERPDESEPRLPPARFVSRSDADRKLDELERRSRRVRTRRLRERARKAVREAAARDW